MLGAPGARAPLLQLPQLLLPQLPQLLLALLLQLLVLSLLSPGAFAQSQQDFCNICSDHTACQYSGVGQNCMQGRFVDGVALDQQQVIVDLHNQLRNRVALGQEQRGSPGPQPPAANMQRVIWDNDVAFVAQRWADQCTYRHDTCRNLPNTYVGQNIYLRSQWPAANADTSPNWTEPIFAWYDEAALTPNSIVNSFQANEQIGHYTQMVWATTNRVGCGYAFFQDGDWAKKYYVCDYAPGGNYIGQPLYQTGAPRSACSPSSGDTGTADPRYPGLCGQIPATTPGTSADATGTGTGTAGASTSTTTTGTSATGAWTGTSTSTTGARTATNTPTGARTGTNTPTGARTGTNTPTGARTGTNTPTGARTGTTGAGTGTLPAGRTTGTATRTGAVRTTTPDYYDYYEY